MTKQKRYENILKSQRAILVKRRKVNMNTPFKILLKKKLIECKMKWGEIE